MNYNDITIGIVSFKSEKVIFECLKSIKKINKIIIFDNLKDKILQKKVKKFYPKIKFILSKKNLGYGKANNKIIKICKTKFLFILNPDTILKKYCEHEMLRSIKKLKNNFSIISPISNEKNYNLEKKKNKTTKDKIADVDFVKGFAMLINIKEIKKIGMFDENIFLYLEEIDLCKRLKFLDKKICLAPNIYVKHFAGKSHDPNFSDKMEIQRNWHYMWSLFYFNKKYKGFLYAFKITIGKFISAFFKLIIFFIINKKKHQIYKHRFLGLLNSYLNKKSKFRS